MKIGWERKIGYSFVGLMAGNAVSVVVLFLIALLPQLEAFAEIRKGWNLPLSEALGLSLLIWLVSMGAWVIVGLPVVLLLQAEIVADFYWVTAGLMGAVMGAFAMALIYVAPNPRHIDIAAFRNPETLCFFFLAALISGVAFAVYCALVWATLRRQAKESGAPKGTPRSLPWFDF